MRAFGCNQPGETTNDLAHWLDSYGEVPADIDPDAYLSVVALAEDAMARYADKTAFVGAGQALRKVCITPC